MTLTWKTAKYALHVNPEKNARPWYCPVCGNMTGLTIEGDTMTCHNEEGSHTLAWNLYIDPRDSKDGALLFGPES